MVFPATRSLAIRFFIFFAGMRFKIGRQSLHTGGFGEN
jgi:hypothetical protein